MGSPFDLLNASATTVPGETPEQTRARLEAASSGGGGLDWGGLGSAVIGGPLGYLGYQGYKKQQAGNDAANQAMTDAQAQIKQMQASQRAQRQADLSRALGYFSPYNDAMKRMYGVSMPAAGGMPGGPPAPRPGQDGTVPAGSQNVPFRDGPDLTALRPTQPRKALGYF